MSDVLIIKLFVIHFLHLRPTWPKYPGERPPFAFPQYTVSHIKGEKISRPYFLRITYTCLRKGVKYFSTFYLLFLFKRNRE